MKLIKLFLKVTLLTGFICFIAKEYYPDYIFSQFEIKDVVAAGIILTVFQTLSNIYSFFKAKKAQSMSLMRRVLICLL